MRSGSRRVAGLPAAAHLALPVLLRPGPAIPVPAHPPPRRRRHRTEVLALAAAALHALVPAAPLAAQAPSTAPPEVRAAVDALLPHTDLEAFVAGALPAFEDHVVRMSTHLGALEAIREVAGAAFDDALLEEDVAAWLASEAGGDAERVRRVLAWLRDGAAARLRAITDTTPPPQGFDAFMDELDAAPPSPERLDLVRRWTGARRAGEFIVLLDEAQREAAQRVTAAVDPDAPPFHPMTARAFAPARAEAEAYAVLTFLHRLQPVPDRVLEGAVAEYASADGRWFVEAYTLALAHAVRRASERAVDALAARPGAPGPG